MDSEPSKDMAFSSQEQAPPEIKNEIKESPLFKEFSSNIASLATPEEKIAVGIEFMRKSISQEGAPRFREFWEARKLVLPVFKENLNPIAREKLWGEYVELTVEARRLKEILEEQSAFAMEQIDLAINALTSDLQNFETLLAQVGEIQFPPEGVTLQDKEKSYNEIQRELNLLNALASRLNGLRKEVMKTDMRIRFKTKFFKRLSELGDQIFPKRKKLIDTISLEFEKDVDSFIEKYFQGGVAQGVPYYALREEIKALQGMAKVFTLNSGAFSRTRLKLSQCWDEIKELEKERKKISLEKRRSSLEEKEAIEKRIDELQLKSAEMTLSQVDQEIDLILKEMRNRPLHREDVFKLKEKIGKIREPYLAQEEQRLRELEEKERERIRLKKEKIAQLDEKIVHLTKVGKEQGLELFSQTFEEISQEINSLELSKMEKHHFQRHLRFLKELLADKKEEALLNLSEDDKRALENLRMVLQQKRERRQEIKERLEGYRKTLGSSGLDFEKAIELNEQIDQEKELLEKVNESIGEIEARIEELQ